MVTNSPSDDGRRAVKRQRMNDTPTNMAISVIADEEEDTNISPSQKVIFQEDIVTKMLSYIEISDIGQCSEVSRTCLSAISRLEGISIIDRFGKRRNG